MKRLSILGLLMGVALLSGLILWQGLETLEQLFSQAGPSLWLLPLFYLLPYGCAALSWHALFAPKAHPPWSLLLYGTWISLAINWLLPVGQIGGELARIRLLRRRRHGVGPTVASVVADQTLQIFTLALYSLLAMLLLTSLTQQRWDLSIVITGLVIAAVSWGVYRLQRGGLFQRFARVAQRFVAASPDRLQQAGAAIDTALAALYGRRRRLLQATAWRVGFRLLSAAEVWLAVWCLGHHLSPLEAVIIEGLAQGIRSAAFVIPGGLGAQEGGDRAGGICLGVTAQVALALSLCKRFRELVLGMPGLLVWQWQEGWQLLTGNSSKQP
ncbi:hypothetical protein XM38_041630 [Halomicronema hongdechloris C2206]|uniref:TIGR00374 family protein n=1 Tax=Halomicronema hongdechloris C2206 TaxID=1641165 RepID=A0A1Z3HSB2_9CYAN|nr:flippase-like domain-containing protein [Halomicronema hongdechloris]ASC73201.1 hypothetical protein XM38_041630 [Halomicronema hongdechloris C2206]